MLKTLKILLIPFVVTCILIISYSATIKSGPASSIVLVASTPADPVIKSLLGIPSEIQADFIRWELALSDNSISSGTFILNINYGVSKPNTNGFISGGEKQNLNGSYTVSYNMYGHLKGYVYQLKPAGERNTISFIKLNDNLFHLLGPDKRLISGNGGWSYTLNRKDPLAVSTPLPAITSASSLLAENGREIIFEGRTPCVEIGSQYNLQTGDCIKLKWKLTLRRNPDTSLAGTYILNRTQARETAIEGKWLIKRSEANPDAVIYQLDPDKPAESLSFLMGDENVLFFLDKNNRLFTGNSDFSYTLNRRKQ